MCVNRNNPEKIRNRYNQVPHLTQDNIWESNVTKKAVKEQTRQHNKEQTRNITDKNVSTKDYHLGLPSEKYQKA